MLWLYFAISGYFFLALTAVGDKLLLASAIINPARYVYLIGALGGLIGILLSALSVLVPGITPFNFIFPQNAETIFLSAFIAGICYVVALFAYFSILNRTEASRVVPSIGALIPICTLLFSLVFLRQPLSVLHIAAFFVLVCGTFILSYQDKKIFTFDKDMVWVMLAALLFAAHFVFIKNAYNHLPFFETIVFMQLGFVVAGPALYALFGATESAPSSTTTSSARQLLFMVNQGFGLLGGGLLQYAIAQGNVVLVNAMQGAQYAFLFLLLLVGSIFFRNLLRESYSPKIIVQKIVGIALVALGIVLISLFRQS